MNYQTLKTLLALEYEAFSITRVAEKGKPSEKSFSCINQIFSYVQEQGPIDLTEETISCRGAAAGLGLRDGIPDIPGGFGNFIAQGAGPGFPPGECIKASPALGEAMLCGQPQNIMTGYSAIRVGLYKEEDESELVCLLANPDQLSALLHLFCFRRPGYDEVMVPVVSGCAQIFRIPFGELGKQAPKGVIGNIDFFSRPHLPKDLFSFTVPTSSFREMCQDVKDSFLYAPAWKGVKKRLLTNGENSEDLNAK